jgi:hypothetical protein
MSQNLNIRALRMATALLVAALGAACAAVPTPASAPASAPLPAAEPCFPVESLAAEERAMADSLLAAGLDNEPLFTLAGTLKPMSSIPLIQLGTARIDTVPEGSREVADPDSPDLDRIERYQRVANSLSCGPVRMVVAPFRMTQDTVRRLQVNFLHRGLLDAEIARNATFWGQWGFVPGTDPAVVVTVVEYERPYDRFRGYGYLFGYPEHAVTFFVEAAREGDARGELVPREFIQIPVHSRPDARFVYAVPPGHVPTEADLAIRAEAARVLEEYRARRPRYENADGTLRAVELLRDWYAERIAGR